MKTPLGTELDLGAGNIVLDGFPALRERGTAPPPLLGSCLLWPRSPISATNWMSAAAVAVVATSGERHEGKAGVMLFAGKTV